MFLTAIKVFMGAFIVCAMIFDRRAASKQHPKYERHDSEAVSPSNYKGLYAGEKVIVAEATALACGVDDPCLIVGRGSYRELQCSCFFRPPMSVISDDMRDMIPKYNGMHVYLDDGAPDETLYVKSEGDYIAGKQIQR